MVVWWQNVVALVGLGLQVLGTARAVRGVLKTWSVYSTEPLAPAWAARAMARVQGLQARLRRLVRGPRHIERHAAHAITATAEGSAYDATVIAWDALPADHEAAIGELERRLRALLQRVLRVDHESRTAIRRVGSDLDRLRSDLGLKLHEEARQRNEDDRTVATSGARAAVQGLLLIGAGLLLQLAAVAWALLGGTTA
ncbi:MAG: hypothetical protein A2146_03740 [Actinobacteria bacterium RBG_16_67_10]|nr:MAG: hypothetical protein A2146_03740 [Actinobacteria bacterium RBG_16_67_10]